MKAIIISDTDARALLDKLELTKMKDAHPSWRDPNKPASVGDIHRAFHYVVCTWLQEQGADCTGR